MKTKDIKNTMTILICASIFAGCSKEQDTPQGENNKITEFIAYNEGSLSRTVLEENKVLWIGGEEISIFNGDNNYRFKNATEGKSATAVFHGELTATTNEFYALYPYNENAVINSTTDAVTITTNIPAEQTAVAGTFANNLNINVCKASDDKTLKFKNACGIIKFILEESVVDKISLTSSASIAGTYTITLDETITGTVTDNTENSKTIILKPEEGSFIQKGQAYYMIVPAGISLNNANLKVGEISCTINNNTSVPAGVVCTINIKGESVSIIQFEDLNITAIEEIAPIEEKDRIKLNTNNANLSINNADAAKSLFDITVTNTNGISVADEYTVEKVELEENTKNIILTLNKPVYTDDKISVTYNADGSSDAIKADDKWVKITTDSEATYSGYAKTVYNFTAFEAEENVATYFNSMVAEYALENFADVASDGALAVDLNSGENATKIGGEILMVKNETDKFTVLSDAKYTITSEVKVSDGFDYTNDLVYRLIPGKNYNVNGVNEWRDYFKVSNNFSIFKSDSYTPTSNSITILDNNYYDTGNFNKLCEVGGKGSFRVHLNAKYSNANDPNQNPTVAVEFYIKNVKITEEALRPGRSYSVGNTHNGFGENEGITGSINSNEEEN